MGFRSYFTKIAAILFIAVLAVAGCGDDSGQGNENDNTNENTNENTNQNHNGDAGVQGAAHLVGYVYAGDTEQPLADVQVYVEELGVEATTDTEGRFVLPVPEAERYVVAAEREGYSYGLRRIRTAPGHVKAVPPIYLAPLDPVTTDIEIEGGVHTNSDGSVELEFLPGSLMTAATVRTTRYERGKVLPAPLPPLSRVTTAVDVDLGPGELSGSAVIRVANTMGFDPGTEVPVGWLDRETGIWHADGMGVVTEDGLFLQYEATHFSSLDLNFPAVVDGNPAAPSTYVGNVKEPNECVGSSVGVASGNLTMDHVVPAYRSEGMRRVVALVYRSDTVRPTADIQLHAPRTVDTGGTPTGVTPSSVKIVVDLEGRYEDFHYEGADGDQSFAHTWDGVNGLGDRVPSGVYPARIEVVRYYDQAEYATAACFGCPPLESLGIPTTEPVPIPSETTLPVPIDNRSESAVGVGWSVGGLRRLYRDGSGAFAMVSEGGAPPRTYEMAARGRQLAGTGVEAFNPPTEGHAARASELYEPRAVAADSSGTVFFADQFSVIWRIDSSGNLVRVAGTGTEGYSGDGGAAVDATISRPRGLAASGDELFIVETGNHVIRRVDAAGVIHTVAGDGADGWGLTAGEGDGGAATATSLYDPRGVAVDDTGNVLFTDGHGCLRQVDTAGVLTSLACDLVDPRGIAVAPDGSIYVTTEPDVLRVAPDGTVSLFAIPPRPGFNPVDVVLADPDGIYVLDAGRNQVCRLTADGTYELVAGVESNTPWNALALGEDGGPASEIPLDLRIESGMARDPDGNLVVTDGWHNVIWRMDTSAASTGAAVYRSQAGDSRTLERQADGTYRYYLAPARYVTFDAAGLQTSSVDARGRVTTFAYDGSERLVSVTDPAGRETALAYNADGLLATITDPAGRVTTLTHDADGNLTRIADPLSQETVYTYDAHRLTGKTDPAGFDTVYGYDGDRVTTVTLATGEVRSYGRDAMPGDTAGMAPGEGTEGNPATGASGATRDVVVTDGEGNETTMRIAAGGQLTQVTDPLGRITTMRYDRFGQLVSRTGPDGIERQIVRGGGTYRLRGVVRSTQLWDDAALAESMPMSLQWDETLGKVTAMVLPGESFLNTATTQFTYDADGHLVTVEDALGHQGTQVNNTAGQPTSITDATGRTWTVTYDAHGNVSQVSNAIGITATYQRDSAGLITQITDGLGRNSVVERDALGRVTAVTDPAGHRVAYGYTGGCGTCGSAGRPTSITDPLGRTRTLQYDAVGNLVQSTDSEGGVWQYVYDLNRRLVSTTAVDGIVTTITRDAAGRIVSVEDGDGRVTDVSYDDGDRVAVVEDDAARFDYSYDAFGYPIQASLTSAAGDSFITDVVVEPWNGLVTQITDPEGRIQTLEYTERHEVRQAFLDSSADPDEAFWFQYEYDEAGRLERRIMSDPSTSRSYQTEYNYDTAGRFSGIVNENGSLGTLWQSLLTRDAAGRITGVVTTHGTLAYTYNDADRLAGVTYSGAATVADETFTYDAMGNRTDDGQVYGTLDRLTEDTTYTYTYDSRGRMTGRTHKVTGEELLLDWNDRNQLTTAERYDGVGTLVGTTSYTYDPNGRRIARDVDGVRTQTAWQGFAPTASYDDAGVLITQWYRCPMTGELVGVESGAYRGYVFNDHLGSPRAVAGYTSTTLAWQAEYPAYGDAEVDPAATLTNPHRFLGQTRDGDTGLHYNVIRYYEPQSGRYLSPDPIWSPAHSRYAYVGGNPAMYVDPLGLMPPGSVPPGAVSPRGPAGAETGPQGFGALADALGDALDYVYRNIVHPVKRDFKRGLDGSVRQIKENFNNTCDAWQNTYDCMNRCVSHHVLSFKAHKWVNTVLDWTIGLSGACAFSPGPIDPATRALCKAIGVGAGTAKAYGSKMKLMTRSACWAQCAFNASAW